MVKEKYAQTFQEVLTVVTELDFDGLHWGAEQVQVLADSLPACK